MWQHYGLADDDSSPLYLLAGGINLIAEHTVLATEIDIALDGTKPVAVVLDTLNRSLVGSENRDVDMAAYIRAAESVRDKFGCVVIIVHHCGYNEERLRGHSSLPPPSMLNWQSDGRAMSSLSSSRTCGTAPRARRSSPRWR
jgi:hypothetical protein